MKVSKRAVFALLVLALGALSFALASPASATIIQGSGCPSNPSSVVCLYYTEDFNSYIDADHPTTSCASQPTWVFGGQEDNNVGSIRNRTGCYLALLYYSGSTLVCGEIMIPHSNDDSFGGGAGYHKIDQIDFRSTKGTCSPNKF